MTVTAILATPPQTIFAMCAQLASAAHHRLHRLLYDVGADPGERRNLVGHPERSAEEYGLVEASTARWDLERLDAEVRASQQRRRLVARALATGRLAPWDHPTENPAGPYIRSGQDFWTRLEEFRRP